MRAARGDAAVAGFTAFTSSVDSNRSCTRKFRVRRGSVEPWRERETLAEYSPAALRLRRIAGYSPRMRKLLFSTLVLLLAISAAGAASLPFSTVFKGQDRFERLVNQARKGNWKVAPDRRSHGDGWARINRHALKDYTLKIDNRIERPR